MLAKHPELKEKHALPLDTLRAYWQTEEVSRAHCKDLEEELVELGIQTTDENGKVHIELSRIITSDECPNPLGPTSNKGQGTKVLAGSSDPAQRVEAENRERVSMDVYVGLDGHWYDPHIIAGSQSIYSDFIPPECYDPTQNFNMLISSQENAFQDGNTYLEATKHLDKQIADRVRKGELKYPVMHLTDGGPGRFNAKVRTLTHMLVVLLSCCMIVFLL